MPIPDAEMFATQWVSAWNPHDVEAVLWCPSPGEWCGVRRRCAATGPRRCRLPGLHFDVIGVYRGESTLVINYRNHRGEVVNEVLTFDGTGLVVDGHGTYLAG